MEVEPVRNISDVKRMYNYLNERHSPKEAECWLIGCNVALRAGDLLKIRFDQVEPHHKKIVLNEQKTGKHKEIPITPPVRRAVERLRQYYANNTFWKCPNKKDWKPTYLFQGTSRRAFHLCQPLCIQWLSYCIKTASRELEFDFNCNTHSMRKTWGYHAYERGEDIHYLQALFNHSNPRVTLRYIGVTKTTIQQMYFENSLEIA